MSETVSWQFVGRRLDSVQADTADIRRQMITLADRFGALESRMAGIEHRQGTLEARMDAMVERQSKLEETGAQTLYLLQRLALKVGGIDDDTA
jgi:hypothetical protein